MFDFEHKTQYLGLATHFHLEIFLIGGTYLLTKFR